MKETYICDFFAIGLSCTYNVVQDFLNPASILLKRDVDEMITLKDFKDKKNLTYYVALLGLFAALSVVLMLLVRIPLFPPAHWLEYDLADIPILLATFLIHPLAGMFVLLVVSLIQAFTVSAANGMIGFVMHVASSGVMVLVSGYFYSLTTKRMKSVSKKMIMLVVSLILGGILMTLTMIPLNIVFTPITTGLDTEAVKDMIFPFIVPFNLIKAAINCMATFFIYWPLEEPARLINRNR